eukprot:scaffold113954_cov68-Phaeocystis_antarctica.AAC.1
MGHRHPKDEPCAVERHGKHVQGRGGSDCGSSLAGRTQLGQSLRTPTRLVSGFWASNWFDAQKPL